MDKRIKNVCEFYAITHRLKNLIRAGQTTWAIERERFESVAEHVYGSQMLALAIHSEFDLKLDLKKVALMIAIHELGECVIGDLGDTGCPISKEEKARLELEAVQKIFAGISNAGELLELFAQFEERKTDEAKFAYLVEKIECDFEFKYNEEMGYADEKRVTNKSAKEMLLKHKKYGCRTLVEGFIEHDRRNIFGDDKIFNAIAEYLLKNKVFN
ncbi:MAG: HD domain-containing protein [Firmicutes bacterium]|nr:HD domain-containing protein [Bacillota bacterium]